MIAEPAVRKVEVMCLKPHRGMGLLDLYFYSAEESLVSSISTTNYSDLAHRCNPFFGYFYIMVLMAAKNI